MIYYLVTKSIAFPFERKIICPVYSGFKLETFTYLFPEITPITDQPLLKLFLSLLSIPDIGLSSILNSYVSVL